MKQHLLNCLYTLVLFGWGCKLITCVFPIPVFCVCIRHDANVKWSRVSFPTLQWNDSYYSTASMHLCDCLVAKCIIVCWPCVCFPFWCFTFVLRLTQTRNGYDFLRQYNRAAVTELPHAPVWLLSCETFVSGFMLTTCLSPIPVFRVCVRCNTSASRNGHVSWLSPPVQRFSSYSIASMHSSHCLVEKINILYVNRFGVSHLCRGWRKGISPPV